MNLTSSANLTTRASKLQRAFPTRLGILFALIALLVSGCGEGCSKDSAKKATTAQQIGALEVDQLTAQLPQNTDMAVVIRDLAQMRGALNTIQERLGTIYPIVQIFQTQIQSELGVNILNAQTWTQAGFSDNSDLVIAAVENRPVVIAKVDNRQAFEKEFIERIQKAMGIEGTVRNETIGKHQIKFVGSDPILQMAWAYSNNIAILGLPAFSQKQAIEGKNAALVVSEIASTQANTSLATAEAFQRFQKALIPEYPISLYVSEHYLSSSTVEAQRNEMGQFASLLITWLRANTEGVGFGLNADQSRITLKTFAAAEQSVLMQAQEALTPAEHVSWNTLATDKTLIATRLSLDFAKFWGLFLSSIPDEQRRHLRREIQRMGSAVSLNLEDDLLAHLSGNASAFFYGIEPAGFMQNINDPIKAMESLGLILSFQFTDKDSLELFVGKLTQASHGMLSLRSMSAPERNMNADIRVLELKNVAAAPGSIYLMDSTLTFATSAFSEFSVYQYLTGHRPDRLLVDIDEMELGAKLIQGQSLTGVYFNGLRAVDHISAAVPVPAVRNALGALQEALFEVDANDTGISGVLTIDLTTPPAQ